MACGCIGGDTQSAKSVELRGYNFTLTDAEGWFTDTTAEDASSSTRLIAGSYGGAEMSTINLQMQLGLWEGWKGSVMERAFYKPDSDHDASVSQRKYMDGIIAVYVLDSIDANNLTYDSALEEAAWLPNDYMSYDTLLGKEMDEEKTTIDGKDAYIVKHPDGEMAVASVQLTPDMVAVISVGVDDADPEDIIEELTISKSS
ncbi:MAG TPA: hypothetical protein PK738_04915 [Bacteroidales bacterium]|nr:hypothetical protein [Bacteroidales bacterium]